MLPEIVHFLADGLGTVLDFLVQAAQLVEFNFAADFGLHLVQVALGAAIQGACHAGDAWQFFRTDDNQCHHANDGELR
jgi:hypothetical protein